LLDVMARLRAPDGCPWDREQDHRTLRWHAVEEVYELVDAIEAGDDSEMAEELGDLLLQIVFHAQLAKERGAFDFDSVCGRLVEKLIRRHPHVFGQAKSVKTTQAVWAQWDQIKKAEKAGARIPRHSALDGIPRHLPALLRAEKLAKKARKAGLVSPTAKTGLPRSLRRPSRPALGRWLFELTAFAQARGWSAEELLRMESQRREQRFRSRETKPPGSRPPGAGPVPATRPTGLQ
jgi:NTP pyrophosphatase (non-canonical NTP hydrolase)